jgi:hypothetical protein
MKEGEVKDINKKYPLMRFVLGLVGKGEKITSDSPFYETRLMARQRGFTGRDKTNPEKRVVSDRGKEFLERK